MEDLPDSFQSDDHRAAYIFHAAVVPSDDAVATTTTSSSKDTTSRPSKRQKVSSKDETTTVPSSGKKKNRKSDAQQQPAKSSNASSSAVAARIEGGGGNTFPVLLNGLESPEAAALRKETFEKTWPVLEERVRTVLKEANRSTLEEVTGFFGRDEDGGDDDGRIPAAFVIAGPNITSQDLLFEQLAEALEEKGTRFVRLVAAEVGNLKGALKRIVQEGSRRRRSLQNGAGDEEAEEGGGAGGEEEEVVVRKGGRKFLDYDLEALYVALGGEEKGERKRVIVAFQDSEAFDTGLLTDLVTLFHSWHDRIQFSILFGIATSVELFEARMLKSTARQLRGAQFDVVQANAVLESVVKTAVAGTQAKLRIGPLLLSQLVRRQEEQVAGIHTFVSSIKYAYMNHFYANPLSLLLAEDGRHPDLRKLLSSEHLEAIRTLESFKSHVHLSVEAGQLKHAQSLLEDDNYLTDQILEQAEKREQYLKSLLRSLLLTTATTLTTKSFTELYESALEVGIALNQSPGPFDLGDAIKRSNPSELVALITRITTAIQLGSPELLGLEGWEAEVEELVCSLTEIRDEVEGLVAQSKDNGTNLKSQYSAQSKVLRTTVVAQKVQLSRDTATLTEEDKAFTKAIDAFAELLYQNTDCDPISALFLHEIWQYDFLSPYEDVFVPRPGNTIARALHRPHDYLGCACCDKADGALVSTLPTTAILYHLYSEAGALINVADLWSSYYALVGDETDIGLDERSALARFYHGLAELRAMGFIKQSKKKADHVAKLNKMEPPSPHHPNNNSFLSTHTTTTRFGPRRAAHNPAFEAKLQQMALRLAPLVQLTTGTVHPDFPQSLLCFWLLTDDQLDSLAHFYHQRTPSQWTTQYPCPVYWPPGLTLEEKRRKLGKFIGLRGCDTPALTSPISEEVLVRMRMHEAQILEDVRRQRLRDSEAEEIRRKMGWY
ncbi:origin recognition complex subunit 3 N-terminus-domain-containing protein [Podospora australis]|uniref:Origin recognition complex subunit 3 N-terminus-domain-containing protein n=1 Tax=Podospora australis TaxID=1536484 RepID=A0AAN6X4H0_9PEZI|nr:origin recognition complex subunit 3 N-terminus-domain-containing protein [Podospora australis]